MPIFKMFDDCSMKRKLKEERLIELYKPELNATDRSSN